MSKSIFDMLAGFGKTTADIGKLATSPAVWGLSAAGKSNSILGYIGRRAIGPGVMVGGFAALGATRNLLGGAYSIDSPRVAWGHTPGMTTPSQDHTMTFDTANRTTQSMGATGSLAFALHNQRKS